MRRVAIVLAFALPLAAVDLVWKTVATTPDWAYHPRSVGWLALSLTLFVATLGVARVPSVIAAAAAGVMAGGGLPGPPPAPRGGPRAPAPTPPHGGGGRAPRHP